MIMICKNDPTNEEHSDTLFMQQLLLIIQIKYILLMRQPDLIRTIQNLQAENQHLKAQLGQRNSVNFEQKYMKALRQISAIMNANKQFKQELMRFREQRSLGANNEFRIQKQEMNKAYEKLLMEKNQLYGERQNLELQNQKLKYTVASLQETIANLKSQKRTLAQEKESLRIMSPKSEKQKGRDMDIKKNMQNYEEHHASLNKIIQKLQEDKRSLENKLYEIQSQFSNRFNQKQIQVRQAKAAYKQEYDIQINELRRQISKLKVTNNELSIKIQSNTQDDRDNQGNNDYQKQLINTLRDVKAQMQPMRHHIAQLQQKNQFEKQETERQKASLEIKVIELQSEIIRMKQIQKMYETKQVRQSQTNRRIEDSERTIKKLEEQNRMLGGRLIVLEAKEVALRNRSGDQLEERVLQFQNRVEMLLSDKETVANMKNVGIHQLIALKAYILELDAKLKQLVNQNQYAVKKYKTYKQKCSQLIKDLKQHDIAINALKGKLQGYDRLVVKLQGQFQRAISINDAEIKALNIKISEQSAISIEVYKKRYDSLVEKLSLQQKYSEQQLETLKLNYETKIVQLNLRLEQLNSIKETIGLYKTKNQQLSIKLSERQNQLLEARINKSPSSQFTQPRNPNKDTIQRLNQTINSKQAAILNLQNQLRKVQSQWKSKYAQLQQKNNSANSKRKLYEQQKQDQIDRLEQDIKNYRNKISELENKLLKMQTNEPNNRNELEYRQYQQIANKKSELEIDIDKMRIKYESETQKNSILTKKLNQAKRNNQQLDSELTKLRYEIKNLEKQMQLELEEKANQIRRLRSRSDEISSIAPSKMDISETMKISSLKIQIQSLQSQIQLLQKDKQRYYNKTIELQKQNVQLDEELQRIKFDVSRLKNANNQEMLNYKNQQELSIENLEYTIRVLKDKVKNFQQKQNQIDEEMARMRAQWNREKTRLLHDIEAKEQEYNKLYRQYNRLRSQLNGHQDTTINIQNQFQFKIARFTAQINSYKQQIDNNLLQIQRYEKQIRRYRQRQAQLMDKIREIQSNTDLQERHRLEIQHYEAQLRKCREKQNQFNMMISDLEYKLADSERALKLENNQLQEQLQMLENRIQKYQQDLRFYQQRESQIEQGFADRESYATKLASRINQLEQKQTEHEQQIYEKGSQIFRLNSELKNAKSQLQIAENSLQSKDSQISRLTQQNRNIRIQYGDLEQDIYNKDSSINRLKSEISSLKNQVNSLQEMLQQAQKQANKWKYQHTFNQQQSSNIKFQLDQKQSTINRLNGDIKSKTQQINDISEQLQNKNFRITELQSQIMRLRNSSADFENQMMEKNAQISRLNFDLNAFKNRYNQLQEQTERKETQWQGMNRQLLTIRANVEQYQQELITKQGLVERYKKDIKDLNEQIDRLNGQIFDKNKQINSLNQQIFRLKLQSDQKSSTEIYRMQSEISQLKSKVNLLENQLQNKQYQLDQTQNEIRTYRTKVTSNKYSDQEYQMLQTQYYQLQNTLNSTNHKLNDKDFEIQELISKIKSQEKLLKDMQSQYQNDKQYLEKQIEGIMKRERKLKVDYEALQTQYQYNVGGSKQQIQKKQFGMHLYETQVDRLNGIVSQLTEQIEGLKLKMTTMTNQQDRIVENLTLMTLTFAEVQALRDRMKTKQNQISQVRKSLIQYASSSNEQLSLTSKKILQMNQEYKSRNFLTQQNISSTIITNKQPVNPAYQNYQISETSNQYTNQISNLNAGTITSEDSENVFAAKYVQSYGASDGFTNMGNRDKGLYQPQTIINEVDYQHAERGQTGRFNQNRQMKESDLAHSYSDNSNKFQSLVRQQNTAQPNQVYYQQQSERSGQAIQSSNEYYQNQNQSISYPQSIPISHQQTGQFNIKFGGSSSPNTSLTGQQNIQPTPSGSFNAQQQPLIKAQSPGIPQNQQILLPGQPMQRPQQYPNMIPNNRPPINFSSSIPPQQGFYVR